MGDARGDARDEQATDDGLVQRALEGDEGAFALLYSRHAPLLARRLQRVLFRKEDVEDVLQMTFLEVHRRLARHRRDAAFAAWLHGVAFKVTGTFLRGRRRRAWLSFESDREESWVAALPPATSEEQAMKRELLGRTVAAIERLAPKKRIVFTLHVVEGLGPTEIGEMLDLSPQTVFARLKSAREEVCRALGGLER